MLLIFQSHHLLLYFVPCLIFVFWDLNSQPSSAWGQTVVAAVMVNDLAYGSGAFQIPSSGWMIYFIFVMDLTRQIHHLITYWIETGCSWLTSYIWAEMLMLKKMKPFERNHMWFVRSLVCSISGSSVRPRFMWWFIIHRPKQIPCCFHYCEKHCQFFTQHQVIHPDSSSSSERHSQPFCR